MYECPPECIAFAKYFLLDPTSIKYGYHKITPSGLKAEHGNSTQVHHIQIDLSVTISVISFIFYQVIEQYKYKVA